jgi:hypothetical protein
MYGSENWVVNKMNRKWTETAAIKFILRVPGYNHGYNKMVCTQLKILYCRRNNIKSSGMEVYVSGDRD